MSNRSQHDFFDLMSHLENLLQDEWNRIQKWVRADPGTAGNQAELNWANILCNWLPSNYHIVTKGRIINSMKQMSPQIDIIVLHPSYPIGLRDKKLYFSSGVVAAFECKLTLTLKEMRKAFKNSFEFKKLYKPKLGDPYNELHLPIMYGILSHSHDLKSTEEKLKMSIHKRIRDITIETLQIFERKNPSFCHPRYLTDIISIANVATFSLQKALLIGNFKNKQLLKTLYSDDPSDCLATYYLAFPKNINNSKNHTGKVLGALIAEITKYLAYQDHSLREFSNYLFETDIWIGEATINSIKWQPDVFSSEVLEEIQKKGFKNDKWSMWASFY
ncbi:MAG: DUF6602 domain-containing protein [Promethearchaeota archaeon]